ncbi:reticulon-4 receptor-like 2 [Branchiostoma lanceolatum]|uniref:reticulon-4 receptor-like 2 n=1 Tax=Branchiostoma lanceolatum TaxID=7740 RepID=UPI0034548195
MGVKRMLVLLLIVLKETRPTAAQGCSCASTSCNCNFVGLTRVPQDLPTTINYLYLNGNSITALSPSDFSRYRNLERLFLASCEISMINTGTFYNLTSLRNLYLDSNQLTNLEANVFEGLGFLETVALGSNQLSSLPADIFEGLGALLSIFLQNNQLSSLPAGIFEGLEKLNRLHLQENQLTSLPADISGLGNLQELYLQLNQLTSLPTFEGFGNLGKLRIDQNQLSTLPADIFPVLASVSDGGVYSVLDISNNPWQCDCNMLPFKRLMNGSYDFESEIICAGPDRPANLTGKSLLNDVNPEDMCEETTTVPSTATSKPAASCTLSSFWTTCVNKRFWRRASCRGRFCSKCRRKFRKVCPDKSTRWGSCRREFTKNCT